MHSSASKRPSVLTQCCHCDTLQRLPERIIERAVKGMLPKGRLGRNIRTHLKVFKGPNHPHVAQQPTDITKEIDLKPKEAGAEMRAKVGALQ